MLRAGPLAGRRDVDDMSNHGFDFRRKHERKTYSAEVLFVCRSQAYSGTIKNISLGGAFIVTGNVNQFSSGDIITITIPFTNGMKSVKRKARVEWQNNEGFAVEFI